MILIHKVIPVCLNINSGDRTFDIKKTKNRFIAKLFYRYPSLFKKWASTANIIKFDHSPWTKLTKEITQSRLALVTTGGVHLKSQIPFNMKDPSGDPTFREIPADIKPSGLIITHDYYDHKDADKDINIVLPIERVQDLKRAKDINDVNHRNFSFMGHIKQHHIDTLVNNTAPKVAEALKLDGVDIAILTPA
jgi:D-proline reductase (dithiol) PrdB